MVEANMLEQQVVALKCRYCKSETDLFGADDVDRLWHVCGDRERRHYSECAIHGKHVDPFYFCGCIDRRVVMETR